MYVVIPAHNEEDLLGECLVSVIRSVVALSAWRSTVHAEVVLVLDRCTDGSAAVAARQGVPALRLEAGSVGSARRAGLTHVSTLIEARGVAADEVWVCNTDADCVVPDAWLIDHVRLAASHDLVQGEVCPDTRDLSPAAFAAWRSRHPPGRGSLHGANLGFRLSHYEAAGGFAQVAEHEDLMLVRAMKTNGVRATGGTTVSTSGRRASRVTGGFAGYLRDLDAELDAVAAPSRDRFKVNDAYPAE